MVVQPQACMQYDAMICNDVIFMYLHQHTVGRGHCGAYLAKYELRVMSVSHKIPQPHWHVAIFKCSAEELVYIVCVCLLVFLIA